MTENDGLIYAEERITWNYPEINDATEWACYYWFKSNELIEYSSLGHGETEHENWEPESIFEQWESRLQELKRRN